jgi:restriction endonuclease S subunit
LGIRQKRGVEFRKKNLSPFNPKRYKKMLNGLEAAVINLSAAMAARRSRIDGEYFQKRFLQNAARLERRFVIRDFAADKKPPTIKRLRLKRGFSYLEIANISLSAPEYSCDDVAPDEIPDRATHILRDGDVVVSLVRPNRNAVAFIRRARRLVGTSGLAVLRPRGIAPEYLYAFCKTDFFVSSLMRENTATMYPAASVADVLDIPILSASAKFQDAIAGAVRASLQALDDSAAKYAEAENMLLRYLGLEKWQPPQHSAAVVNFATAQKSDRLDAEYYHPQYADILRCLWRHKTAGLSDVCRLHTENHQPETDKEYRYIELANIGDAGDISGYTSDLGKLLPTRARRKVKSGDVIVSSIEGSLASCAIVSDEYNDALCSTGFFVVDSKKIKSEVLLVIFKSAFMQALLKRAASGTILTSVNADDFARLPIPLLDDKIQKSIAQVVKQSFALRHKSATLLNESVFMVETAIEKTQTLSGR